MISEIVKWMLVGAIATNALLVINSVGKPRVPLAPPGAIVVVVANALIIIAILVFWGD